MNLRNHAPSSAALMNKKASTEEARENEDKEGQKVVKIQGDNPEDDDKQIGKWSLREK